jgi:hypothetical protein
MREIEFGLLGLFIVAAMILTCLAVAVIAHRYVEIIESQLSGCSFVKTIRDAFSGAGLLSKIMRGGVIAMVLMTPKLSARKGIVNVQEIHNLPRRYKNLLIIPAAAAAFLFCSLITLRITGYYMGI